MVVVGSSPAGSEVTGDESSLVLSPSEVAAGTSVLSVQVVWVDWLARAFVIHDRGHLTDLRTSSASPVVVGPSVCEADSSGSSDSAVVSSGTSVVSVQVVCGSCR